MPEVVHASCVDLDGQGVLITGASGTGKSTLALDLIGQGAVLVADDKVSLEIDNGRLIATRPATLPAAIEVRGLGLLTPPTCARTPLALVVDLDRSETERLPPIRDITKLGCRLPLLYKAQTLHFGLAIALMLRHSRTAV